MGNPEKTNSNEIENNNTQLDKLSKEDLQKLLDEKQTIVYLSYLSILTLLEDQDLSNLFDGEVNLGQQELLAIYSLIEIANGKNNFSKLIPPKKMELERNITSLNADYGLDYFNDKDGTKYIKSLSGDKTGLLNSTKLNFIYSGEGEIGGFKFERHSLTFDQDILLERENGLVNKLQVAKNFDVDNYVDIKYTDFGKPSIIEQTQLGLASDKIIFEYDENNELISIIYTPAMSLKHFAKAGKKLGKGLEKGILKGIEVAGSYITFKALKQTKGVDVVEINNKNGLISDSKADLNASNWYYKEGFSNLKYDSKGKLQELYLEMEDFGLDDEDKLKLKY